MAADGTTSTLHEVLFIEGVGIVPKDVGERMDMFTESLLGRRTYDPATNMGQPLETQQKIRPLWDDWKVTVLDYDCAWLTTAAEKTQKADEILNAICSGRYRAIVVADLSNSSQFDDFEATFGTQRGADDRRIVEEPRDGLAKAIPV